jgi:hypothetical protein
VTVGSSQTGLPWRAPRAESLTKASSAQEPHHGRLVCYFRVPMNVTCPCVCCPRSIELDGEAPSLDEFNQFAVAVRAMRASPHLDATARYERVLDVEALPCVIVRVDDEQVDVPYFPPGTILQMSRSALVRLTKANRLRVAEWAATVNARGLIDVGLHLRNGP